jgi:transcription termination factor NusB
VAVLPNYNDYSFIKIILDSKSEAWFEENLNKVSELLSQGLVLHSMFEAVSDARKKISSFVKVASDLIKQSESNQIADTAYRYLSKVISYLPHSTLNENYHILYQVTRSKLLETKCPLFALSLVQKLITYGYIFEDVKDLKSWLEGNNEDLNKYELSINDKWRIVYRVNAVEGFTPEEKKSSFDTLYALDESDEKKNFKILIEGVLANAEERENLLKEYFNKDTKWSYVELE